MNSPVFFTFHQFWSVLKPTFVSFYFIAFVFILCLIYYLIPQKHRWLVLLAGSVLFYSTAGLEQLLMILLSSMVVFFSGLLIAMTDKEQRRKRRLFLSVGIFVLIVILLFSKLYRLLGLRLRYIIPLGISYYTFSAIGYLADVYWGKEPAERNLLRFILFQTFFLKILQGPISKHRQLAPQLSKGYSFDYEKFCFGMQLAVWGYFKKLVIADRIAIFTGSVLANHAQYGGGVLFVAVCLSVVQLYCDFSGCMDIAGGCCGMFGIELEKNFDHPFFSRSVAEFWRRWHITLGTWFKDYVYLPLAISPFLNRLSKKTGIYLGVRASKAMRTVIPLTVVWMLTALWHGTGWNYLMWGAYWYLLIVFATVFAQELKRLTELLRIDTNTVRWKCFQIFRTCLLFVISRTITVPNDLNVSCAWIEKMVFDVRVWELIDGTTLFSHGIEKGEFAFLLMCIVILFAVSLHELKEPVRVMVSKWNTVLRAGFYALALLSVLVFGVYGPGFAESNFIYMSF